VAALAGEYHSVVARAAAARAAALGVPFLCSSAVLDALTEHYERHNANIHRAQHVLAEEATAAYEGGRDKVAGLIHHSDAGSEYLSIRYGAELAAAGIAPSVGSVGDSYDNALAESIVGLYKTEVIDHLGPWETPAQVEAATSEWASWYNDARVMRRTGGRPPAEYEQAWRDGTLGQVPARGPGSKPRRPAEGGGHGRRSLPQGS
jgi:transposase InsO family protein